MATQTSKDTVPLFSVEVDGTALDPLEADLLHEIRITDHLRLPDVCTLAIGYPARPAGNPFQGLDDSAFRIGSPLVVRLGATDSRRTEPLFKGEIVTLEPVFEAGSAALLVRAYDRSHRMLRSRRQRAFTNQTASDIVERICGEYGLTAETDASGEPFEYVIQHNETDWDFVWRLATRIGFEFVVDDTTAHFRRAGSGDERVELAYPAGLTLFRPRITAVQQVDEVTVRGFDHAAKRQVEVKRTTPDQVTEAGIRRADVTGKFGPTTLEIAGQSFRSAAEAETIAQGMLDRLANGYLAADGACPGDPRIKAGVKLEISGVGRSYSGTYRVTRAVHTLRGGGEYRTEFSDSPGEQTLAGQAGGGGAAARRADSLVIGEVTSNADPDKLGRVKVKFPALSSEESTWVPVALPSAGKERGLSMLPVPGEEVVVGFENGDPSYPFVLGSVFNGVHTPGPELAVADGSFALRSDHAALIAAKEDITLRTDGGRWVIKVDGGEIKETVVAGKGGTGGYAGQLDGEWKLDARRGVAISSDARVTISATQISVEAKGPLSLKGNPVQIDGGAAVTVSGAIINLG